MSELPCIACKGTCCTGHRGVVQDDGTLLLFVDGRCPNLSAEGRCTIYESRPQDCRTWDCTQDAGYLRLHPHVATLLTLNGIPLPNERQS